MNNYDNLYCKVLIDTDDDEKDVSKTIIDIVSGQLNQFIIKSSTAELYLSKNEDFDVIKRLELPDGFLYSRYYLDIEPNEKIKQEDYIYGIAILLEGLWSKNYKAIAACDYEEELPRKGGYNYGK